MGAVQLAADTVLDSRADNEEQDLEDDSEATIKAMSDLHQLQRILSVAICGKKAPGKGKAAKSKGKGVDSVGIPSSPAADQASSSRAAPGSGGPKAALLRHTEAMVKLETIRTEKLKAAGDTFYASFSTAIKEYQTGLDEYLALTMSAVGAFLYP